MDFESNLFGCCADCSVCMYAYCCAYCAMANNWASIRGEQCGCDHFILLPSQYWTRQEIRKRKHMQPAGLADCCTVMCCKFCAIVQEGREIKTCPPPQSDYYFGQGPQQSQQGGNVVNINYSASSPPPPPQGYMQPPPPQGYMQPPPQGYMQPPPQGYMQPPPQGYSPEEQQKAQYAPPNLQEN